MGFRLEHRIGVAASTRQVWDVLSDFEGWSVWNPLYPKAQGVLRIGEPLTLTLAVPDEPPQVIRPVVEDWVPEAQIIWALKQGALVKRRRYIEIEKLTETGCIFSNGEIFDGLGSRYVSGQRRSRIRRGFVEMGEALKARAEALAAAEA